MTRRPAPVGPDQGRTRWDFKYELKFPDGDDAGTFETSETRWQRGDTVIAHGNQHFRVVAVVPVERIAEFVDEAACGVLIVERI